MFERVALLFNVKMNFADPVELPSPRDGMPRAHLFEILEEWVFPSRKISPAGTLNLLDAFFPLSFRKKERGLGGEFKVIV